jgi:hypothetical protein
MVHFSGFFANVTGLFLRRVCSRERYARNCLRLSLSSLSVSGSLGGEPLRLRKYGLIGGLNFIFAPEDYSCVVVVKGRQAQGTTLGLPRAPGIVCARFWFQA